MTSYVLYGPKSNPPQITGSTNSIPNVILFILSCTNISSWQAYYQKLCTYYGLNRRTSTQLKLRSPKGEIDTDSVLNQLVQNLRQDIFLNKNSIQMFWYWYANFFFFIGMQISNFLTVLHLKETRIKTSIAVLKTSN